MKIIDYDILNTIINEPFINQRILSKASGYSLGQVNKSLKMLVNEGYLSDSFSITDKAHNELKEKRPKNAIILAAGYGLRMSPINMEMPKGLVTVYGEPLIERLITQLISVGVTDITVVVGFMKEQYDYLTDKYNVKLVVNMDYASKNNLHSLSLVRERLNNTYVLPCDIWCKDNPFRNNEWYSWYMVTDLVDDDSTVRATRGKDLKMTEFGGNIMIGISYLHGQACKEVSEKLRLYSNNKKYEGTFWEETLYGDNGKMIVSAKLIPSSDVFEINTYEQLRELDESSEALKSEVIMKIAEVFNCEPLSINDIDILKKGMTNRSFTFTNGNMRYIMRIPGEGTDRLINRKEEYAAYHAISSLRICDDVVYFNPDNGYRITVYFENARVCDQWDSRDVKACMSKLRAFHQLKLKVTHTFDVFERIEFYERLWHTSNSCFIDYKNTKANVMRLKEYLNSVEIEHSLTHIDANPDNFLFIQKDGKEEIRLIDWEYAGMQDPHLDIAMFAIYSMYDREQTDALIDCYFYEGCPRDVRVKIYAYVAMCGLLWSNWCEYKRQMGVEFGEYALRQYRYAKDFYNIFNIEHENANRGRLVEEKIYSK